MEPACPLQAGQRNRRLLPLAWMAGLAGLLGVVGCGVNDYLDASRQTWSTLKQFDEDQRKLGGPAEIPVMERQVAQGTVKGPLLEICFRPPAGFNKAPTLLTQQNQPLKVLQYTSADGKASGGVAGMWLVIQPGRNAEPLKKELAKSPFFAMGEGVWDKTTLKAAGTKGVLNAEWFKPANKPAQPATPTATPTPANPPAKGKAPAPTPKAAPVAPANPPAVAFIIPYEHPQEPASIALVYQPVPGMETAARDLAMRSAATARTLSAAAAERARLNRKKSAPGKGAPPPGAPGTPAVSSPDSAPGSTRP